MLRNAFRLLLVAALIALAASPVGAADSALPTCHMTFTLKGWSVFYATAHGRGVVTCTNGQSMPVTLTVHGGGLSFGKMDVLNGKGTFSAVKSIDEILGSYAAAEANAGAVKSSEAAVYTKGEVSLALAGTGRGVVIGFDFGKLDIERARK
jgi:opacity protein-like surface antigen